MYDFPASPTENQEFVPPGSAQTYIYKAPRWLVKGIPPAGGGGGGGIGEAPEDGQQYARQDADWAVIEPGVSDWADLTGKPTTFPPTVPIPWGDISGKPATFPPDTHSHDFTTGITGKPATYPPDPHSHAFADITSKPSTYPPTLPIAWTDVSGKPATFPPATHSHPQSEVTNLVTDLAGKAQLVHTHAQADVTNLVTDLAGKAPVVHTHPQSDITNLVSDLAAKVGPDVGAAEYRFFARRANAWIDLHAYVDPLHIRQWQYTASTSTPPSTQQVRPNNLTLNLATALYFHKTDMSNQAGAVTMLMNLVTAGFTIGLSTSGDPDAWVMYRVTGAPVFTDPYVTIPVTCLSNGSGTITSGQRCICTFYADVGRVLAKSNLTYYLSPTGSDSNDGRSAGTPLLTFAGLWTKLGNIDISNIAVKVNVADGTYTEAIQPNATIISHGRAAHLVDGITGMIYVLGNTALPQNVVVAYGAYCQSKMQLLVEGVTLGVPYNGAQAQEGFLQVKNCILGSNGLVALNNGRLKAEGNITFAPNNSSSSEAYIKARFGGDVNIDFNAVLAFNSTGCSTSSAFAWADNGTITAENAAAFTAGTNPTGMRYLAENTGVIKVPSGNANFFPGTIAGQLFTSGVYGSSNGGGIVNNKAAAGIAYISDTAPPYPVPGQMWWHSDTGNLYIYYNDGSSSQWVQINTVGT